MNSGTYDIAENPIDAYQSGSAQPSNQNPAQTSQGVQITTISSGTPQTLGQTLDTTQMSGVTFGSSQSPVAQSTLLQLLQELNGLLTSLLSTLPL
jgi:hypothetical protein